jgi:enamine deaminase RidA (YjgF/YER057c/UK114 family)
MDRRVTVPRQEPTPQPAPSENARYVVYAPHLTKRADLAPYNEECSRYFPDNKPARTTVEVMLKSPDLLVEITVTACIPD